MTTVAYKDGIIAADTQLSIGIMKFTSDPKIITLANGVVMAGAGDVTKIIVAQKFFSHPHWEDKLLEAPEFKKGFEALIISKGRVYYCINNCIAIPLGHPFHAMGSGWVLASAAMHMGLSAEDAVKFAGELDIHTNQEVQVVDVKELLHEGMQKMPRGKRTRPISQS